MKIEDEIDRRYEYCEEHTSREADYLHEIYRQTYLKALAPRMLSGHLQGRLLGFLSRIINPGLILEIGTFTAYATLCLAEGLQDKGKLITIEGNDEYEAIIRKHIDSSPFADNIDLRIGNALEIIPKLDMVFDLVFIDAKKLDYPVYYELVLKKVKKGGVIILDNVLWSNKVLDLEIHQDERTLTLHRLNQKLSRDERVESIILPMRDGLNILRKK